MSLLRARRGQPGQHRQTLPLKKNLKSEKHFIHTDLGNRWKMEANNQNVQTNDNFRCFGAGGFPSDLWFKIICSAWDSLLLGCSLYLPTYFKCTAYNLCMHIAILTLLFMDYMLGTKFWVYNWVNYLFSSSLTLLNYKMR